DRACARADPGDRGRGGARAGLTPSGTSRSDVVTCLTCVTRRLRDGRCPASGSMGVVWQDEEGELLNAWRDATRAAELAQRLATSAADALARADVQATESAEIARLAEQAADAAGRAADRARTV